MANQWDIEDGNMSPGKSDRYEWRLPENGEQHQSQTVTPGQLLIKPSDLTLIPTLSPKQSGLQHGIDDWNLDAFIDDGTWYSLGSIVDE